MLRHRFGTVGMLLAAALLATSLFAAFSPAAHADERCWLEKVETEDGIEWVERCEDSGGDDGGEDDGDSGSGEPQGDRSGGGHVPGGATGGGEGDSGRGG